MGEGDQIREYQTGVRCLRASGCRWGHTGSFRCGANVDAITGTSLTEIPHCSSLLPYGGVLSFRSSTGGTGQ